MVYLNPSESCIGGRGLFRHRLTGLERLPITPNQEIRDLADKLELSDEFLKSQEGYENFQNSMIFNPLFAVQENTYINDGNEFWELLTLLEMKPNRLIIFDGRMFHSQYIKPDQYLEAFRVNQILYLSRKKAINVWMPIEYLRSLDKWSPSTSCPLLSLSSATQLVFYLLHG